MAREIEQVVSSPNIRRIIKEHGGAAGRIGACIAESVRCSVHGVE